MKKMALLSMQNHLPQSALKLIWLASPRQRTCCCADDSCSWHDRLAPFVRFTADFADAARAALEGGASVLCDARMVSEGITRARLPADNQVICTLQDPQVRKMAEAAGNTRSAVALELWRPYLDGAVVAIGNAPTALFHLLNMLEDASCPRPAAIIGCPVGFVGAKEARRR